MAEIIRTHGVGERRGELGDSSQLLKIIFQNKNIA